MARTITTYSHMFVMGLQQGNKVYNHGQDELHRSPVVALRLISVSERVFYCFFPIKVRIGYKVLQNLAV